MGKRLKVIILLVLSLLVTSELLLPIMMSKVVSQGMMSLAGSDYVTAKLSKTPGIGMLAGSFDTIQVKVNRAKIDKITTSEMNIALTKAQLNINKLFVNREVELQSVEGVDITVVMGQEDLAQYLNQAVKGVKNAVVIITPDQVKASSTFAIGGFANVAVSLEGKIIGDGQKIKFVTEKVLINNMLAGNMIGSLLTEIPLVDLNKLPFHVGVRDIVMENGKVMVYLDNRLH